MMVRVKGASLDKLSRQLRALSSGEAKRVLLTNLAAEGVKQVNDSFREGRDPYGRPWAPTLRGGSILMKTRRLVNSVRPSVYASGFRIATNVVYARVHQYGATIRARRGRYLKFKVNGRWAQKELVVVPRRSYVPMRNLGPIWTPAFVRVIHSVVEHLKRS